MRPLFTVFVAALFAVGPAFGADTPATTVPGPGPQELVEKVAKDLLHDLDANRAELKKDPAKMRAVVDKTLLPSFDADYSARLVLGKYWRDATDQQRKRFIEAFIQSLMRQYGHALVDFTADRMTVLPFKGDAAATTATVRTEIKRDNGTPVPVNYSLHVTPQGWKAWDVTIEGISYVKNFRTDFSSEIEAKGLDAVIQRLESENAGQPAAPTKAAGKGG